MKQSDIPNLAEAIRYAEVTVAKQLNTAYREPELESEVTTETAQYSELLSSAFGDSINTRYIAEESIAVDNLNRELESMDDVLSLADEDADADADAEEEPMN